MVQPVLATNTYEVDPGAEFVWEATKYYFDKDGLGVGNDLQYTHEYRYAFNFTEWGDNYGAEYPMGVADDNGTIIDPAEIAHEYYMQSTSPLWVTDILDQSGEYPVHVYMVCTPTEIATTKSDMQAIGGVSGYTFTEVSTNNFTLDYDDGTYFYKAIVTFNDDLVLEYLFDEMKQYSNGGATLEGVERYEWELTYLPGDSGDDGDDGDDGTDGDDGGFSVDGYSSIALFAAMSMGAAFLILKRRK